jgi:hypothetical protein
MAVLTGSAGMAVLPDNFRGKTRYQGTWTAGFHYREGYLKPLGYEPLTCDDTDEQGEF